MGRVITVIDLPVEMIVVENVHEAEIEAQNIQKNEDLEVENVIDIEDRHIKVQDIKKNNIEDLQLKNLIKNQKRFWNNWLIIKLYRL